MTRFIKRDSFAFFFLTLLTSSTSFAESTLHCTYSEKMAAGIEITAFDAKITTPAQSLIDAKLTISRNEKVVILASLKSVTDVHSASIDGKSYSVFNLTPDLAGKPVWPHHDIWLPAEFASSTNFFWGYLLTRWETGQTNGVWANCNVTR